MSWFCGELGSCWDAWCCDDNAGGETGIVSRRLLLPGNFNWASRERSSLAEAQA